MRILITGGEGQLGRALARALAGRGHKAFAAGQRQLDVTDAMSVALAVEGADPDAVVHCAALTDTARCEREPELAMRVNGEAAGRIRDACAATDGSPILLAVSTNEVFDGTKGAPYREDDDAAPVNAYGRSKLEGERRARMVDTAIVRTSWLYGDGERSFVAKVLAAARAGRPLRFVTDEVASPTSADDLAQAIVVLLEGQQPVRGLDEVYHLTNEGAASRYDWAREIMRLAGLDPSIVQPVTTAELRASGYDGPAKPPYSVLANNRARALGIVLRPWHQALAAHFEQHPELRAASSGAAPAHG